MRILHITTHFFPFVGGLENLVFQLAKSQSKNNEVAILTLKYNKNLLDYEVIEGVEIYRFPAYEIFKNQYNWPKFGFGKKIKTLKPDVIFTHTRFFATSFFGVFFGNSKWLKKTKSIHVEHGQNFVRSKDIFIKFFAWCFDQTLGRYIFKKSDQIVTLGVEGKKFVQKFIAQNQSKKIKIIPNGVKMIKNIKKIPQKNKALFFGRIIQEKGIEEVLVAAKACPNWTFEIVGNDDNFPKKNTFFNLDQKNIKFLGAVSPEKIKAQIQASDLIILPSWSEGNSLAVLESAANARAILATDVGQNKKIVSEEFLVPIKSPQKIIKKLNFLESNFELLEAEGKRNQKKAQSLYSFVNMTRAYELLLAERS